LKGISNTISSDCSAFSFNPEAAIGLSASDSVARDLIAQQACSFGLYNSGAQKRFDLIPDLFRACFQIFPFIIAGHRDTLQFYRCLIAFQLQRCD
jgi:hypothetical protein